MCWFVAVTALNVSRLTFFFVFSCTHNGNQSDKISTLQTKKKTQNKVHGESNEFILLRDEECGGEKGVRVKKFWKENSIFSFFKTSNIHTIFKFSSTSRKSEWESKRSTKNFFERAICREFVQHLMPDSYQKFLMLCDGNKKFLKSFW